MAFCDILVEFFVDTFIYINLKSEISPRKKKTSCNVILEEFEPVNTQEVD